jgi:hypothetical protein
MESVNTGEYNAKVAQEYNAKVDRSAPEHRSTLILLTCHTSLAPCASREVHGVHLQICELSFHDFVVHFLAVEASD